MDINQTVFSRIAPAKKVEIVKNLSKEELLAITSDTIAKMIKETGTRLYKSRDKELRLTRSAGNNWNSEVVGVRTYKGNLIVDLYVQYSNTDTTTSVNLDVFLQPGEYRNYISATDRSGNPRSYYYLYDESDKAGFVRALLLTYLYLKYKERLGEN